jgi:hypothetical protein
MQVVLAIRLQITGRAEGSNNAKQQATPPLLLPHAEVQQAQDQQQQQGNQQDDIEQGQQQQHTPQVKQQQQQHGHQQQERSNASIQTAQHLKAAQRLKQAAAAGILCRAAQVTSASSTLHSAPAPTSSSTINELHHSFSRACPCISTIVWFLWSNTFGIILPLVPYILCFDIPKHVGLMIKELCMSVAKEGPWKALKQSLGGRYVQVCRLGYRHWQGDQGQAMTTMMFHLRVHVIAGQTL